MKGKLLPASGFGRNQKEIIMKYLTSLPEGKFENILKKYRMTGLYVNRDLYGNFMNKTEVKATCNWQHETVID